MVEFVGDAGKHNYLILLETKEIEPINSVILLFFFKKQKQTNNKTSQDFSNKLTSLAEKEKKKIIKKGCVLLWKWS